MNQDQDLVQPIIERITLGHSKEAIKKEVLALGYTTEEFEDAHAIAAIAAHREGSKAAEVSPAQNFVGGNTAAHKRGRTGKIFAILATLLLVVLIVAGALFAYTKGHLQGILGNNLVVDEVREEGRRAATKALFNSIPFGADMFYDENSRSYQGVCDEVVLEGLSGADIAELKCNAGSEGYLAFGALDEATYYCVDANGFAGELTEAPNNEALSCTDEEAVPPQEPVAPPAAPANVQANNLDESIEGLSGDISENNRPGALIVDSGTDTIGGSIVKNNLALLYAESATYSEQGSYSGICELVQEPALVACLDSELQYRASGKIREGVYICLDATENVVERAEEPEGLTCAE